MPLPAARAANISAVCSTSSMRSHFTGSSLQPARLDLREIENVVDDRQQRIRGAVNALGKAPLRRIEAGVQQQAGHPQHAVHRRSQLMAHARDEFALGTRQHLQLRVALLKFARALLHRLLQVAAVAQRAFAPQACSGTTDIRTAAQLRPGTRGARRRCFHGPGATCTGTRNSSVLQHAVGIRAAHPAAHNRPRRDWCRSRGAAPRHRPSRCRSRRADTE